MRFGSFSSIGRSGVPYSMWASTALQPISRRTEPILLEYNPEDRSLKACAPAFILNPVVDFRPAVPFTLFSANATFTASFRKVYFVFQIPFL